MLFLSESYGYIDETQLLEYRGAQFDNIFKKVDIYNRNLRKGIITEGVHQNGNILFTEQERGAINDMLQMMQKKLLEGFAKEQHIDLNHLNEGFGEIKDKLVGKMSGAWKTAMDFLNKVIKSGINTVKDFLKFFVQFFEKLGENANDCLRRSLIKLNVFGGDDDAEIEDSEESTNESLTEAEEKKIDLTAEKLPDLNNAKIDFGDIAKTQKEKSFLECVMEYVQNKVTNRQIEDLDESYMYDETGMLNEGKISDWFQSKLANNKLYQTIVGSKAKSFITKIGSIWGTFMIGAVGSTLCYTVIPLFIDTLAIAFPGVGIPLEILKWAVKLGYLGWQVYKILKNRRKQIQGTDKKLISVGFCIQLIMTVGFFIIGQTGAMTKIVGHLQNSESGQEIIKVVMWPLQKFFKYTGISGARYTLTTVAGKLCNDMAIKFAENGVGDFANMSVQTFIDTMSKLFANYNLSWSNITSGDTGNIPAEQPITALQQINNNDTIKSAQQVIQQHADEVPHNGGVSKKLANIRWEGFSEDGSQIVMHNAGEGQRVDCVIADVRSDYMIGDDFGSTKDHQWMDFGDFHNKLQDLGLQMTMKGVEGLKLFTTINGDPISPEQIASLKELLGEQVSNVNIHEASKLLPMALDKVVTIPAPIAAPVEPLINIPVMTFAERLNKHVPGNICLVLGTNTASWAKYSKEALQFSKIEDKTMKDAISEISSDGKASIEGIGKYLQDLIHKVSNAGQDHVDEGFFDKFKSKSKESKQEKEHKLQDHACAILYVKQDKKDVPAILFDYETMLAVDLIKQPGRKEIRKTPYYFAGLLGSIFIRPTYDMDQLNPERKPSWLDLIPFTRIRKQDPNETRSEILKFLCAIVAKGVKENYNLVGKNFVQYDKESKKYIKNPAVENITGQIPQLGNCTLDQYLAVLNANIGKQITKENVKPLMAILSSNNKKDVKMFINGNLPAFDENGLSQKATKARNKNKATIDYAEKLYPQLNNRDGEFYKELTSKPYKQVAKWILDNDKNINMDILKSDEVVKYLDKTMETYELDTTRPWKDIVKSTFTAAKSDNEFVKNQNIQILIALIWKHYKEFNFKDEKINDKWGYKAKDQTKSEDVKSKEDQDTTTEEKPENFDIPEENLEDIKSKEDQETTTEEKPEEIKDTQKNKYDDWFERVVTSRINKPTKTLYKELVNNETIKNYYQLSSDKANVYSITKDKALHYILYNRFKTGKQPTEQYWTKKVPALIMRMQKAAKKKVDSERATRKTQVIKEFYNIINKYARRNRDTDTKKLWKKMKLEKLNLENILKHFNMI